MRNSRRNKCRVETGGEELMEKIGFVLDTINWNRTIRERTWRERLAWVHRSDDGPEVSIWCYRLRELFKEGFLSTTNFSNDRVSEPLIPWQVILGFLNICSLLAMSFLMSLLIQGVADLIDTCLLGMERFMASRKAVSHFLQKTSVLSSVVSMGSYMSSCLAKVKSVLPYSQTFFVGGLLSFSGALSLRVTCAEKWSDVASGVRISQEMTEVKLDKKTRSIIEDEELVILVGSSTTWVNWKLDCRCISDSFWLCWGSMLKSPQRTRLWKVWGLKVARQLCSLVIASTLELGVGKSQQWWVGVSSADTQLQVVRG